MRVASYPAWSTLSKGCTKVGRGNDHGTARLGYYMHMDMHMHMLHMHMCMHMCMCMYGGARGCGVGAGPCWNLGWVDWARSA